MKGTGKLLLFLLFLSLGAGIVSGRERKGLHVYGLTCEYLRNPLCVDTDRPRVAWKIADGRRNVYGETQTAYQIEVASSSEKLNAGEADVWNSGRVESDRSAQIELSLPNRGDGSRYYWRVRIWNNFGEVSDWSEPAVWGCGLKNWTAGWIGDRKDEALHSYADYVSRHNSDSDFDLQRWRNPPVLPSPLLRKRFAVTPGVKRATVYATAIGCYELWINGCRVGNSLRAPEWTDYGDHLQYQAYDVTDLIVAGDNVIGATLADGWALGRLAGVKWMKSFPHRGFYALDRRLLAELHIELENGRTIVMPTDSSWKICTDGYIREADHFAGEVIDAQKIPSGWTESAFDDTAWRHAQEDSTVNVKLTAQPNEPIKCHTTLRPRKIRQRTDGVYMVDFGQNIAGHCRLSIRGERGDTVTLRHGEWLNSDGSLYTQSLGYARATDRFVLSGGDDLFEPTFTYHGFQYVEVSGLGKKELTADMIEACAEASSSPQTGSFRCSDSGLNRLFENILWTQRNNMQSVLTDNPSRDERTGAMGDIQIFAQSGIFNLDMAAFFTKYLQDMKDVAYNGQFMSMAPSLRRKGLWEGFIGAPGWCEAGLIVPWRLYENYGDTVALRTLYSEMKGHIDATVRENPDLIWKVRHNHNGDWLNANTVSADSDTTYSTTRGATPDDVFATAFLAYSMRLLSKISGVLGEDDDHARYAALADSVKARFIDSYVSSDGRVDGDTQGAYSIALYFDLVPEALREKAFAHLVRCIEEYDCRLSTGFVSTPMMMQLLVDFDRTDLAYRLLTSHRFPSWLYIVDCGASTVWERWDAWLPGRGFQNPGMNSLDHVAFGAVAEWMYRHILGINPDPEAPGYSHFILRPRPGGGLTRASGSYNSIRGEIKSSWKIRGDKTVFRFSVPVNTRATVILPAESIADVKSKPHADLHNQGGTGVIAEIGSGEYTFTVKMPQSRSLNQN